jgi:predicted nucleic acid-binding protein
MTTAPIAGHEVIYVDTSVLLAQALAEDRVPHTAMWLEPLVSSRLLEHEVWTRIHAGGLAASHGDVVRRLLDGIAFEELDRDVLARSLEPFPVRVRTLDALHLSTFDFLRLRGQALELATFDQRMRDAATALAFPLAAI